MTREEVISNIIEIYYRIDNEQLEEIYNQIFPSYEIRYDVISESFERLG
jgi:hypothetical protein